MKILYGVVGEGLGHAMRSRVVLEHLIGAGHTVEIMASGRASDFLRKRFADVNRIHGLHMILEENRVRRGKTLWSNVVGGVRGLPGNLAAYFDLVSQFEPEVVISDFESWTYLYGKNHGLPILSIDNMQVINRCHLPTRSSRAPPARLLADQGVRQEQAAVLRPLPHHLVLSARRSRKKRTTCSRRSCGPRSSTRTPTRRRAPAGLPDQGKPNEALVGALPDTGLECRIYGMRRDLTPRRPARATCASCRSPRPASSTTWRAVAA